MLRLEAIILEARELSYGFSKRMPPVLEGISISIAPGEIVNSAGRPGAASRRVRLLCGHMTPWKGSVSLSGQALPREGFHPVQLVAQTAIFAVNPRWKIGRMVSKARVPDDANRDALKVRSEWYDRFPHELSGGELQRIAILRSIAPGTRYLVADEITAMLDPFIQAEIRQHLMQLAEELNIGIPAIIHDNALLNMIAGSVVEM